MIDLPAQPPAAPDGPGFWAGALLCLGAGLTLWAAGLVALVATGGWPAWTLAFLVLGIWGPIALAAWAGIERGRRRAARLERVGVAALATVRAIRPGGGQVNGRALLRLDVTIAIPGRPLRDTTVRTLAPYHVIGKLRPGTTVPALADPDDPSDAWLDWSAVEPETATSGPLPALRLVAMTERRPGLRHRAELDAAR